MPFKSKAQQRFMFAAEDRGEVPEGTAKRWADHTPDLKKLPEKKGNSQKLAVLFAEKILTEKISTDGRGNVSDSALRTSTRPHENSALFNKVRSTTARSLPETKPVSDGTEGFEGVTKISAPYARQLFGLDLGTILNEKSAKLDPAFRAGFEETLNTKRTVPKDAKSLAQKVAEALLEKATYREGSLRG